MYSKNHSIPPTTFNIISSTSKLLPIKCWTTSIVRLDNSDDHKDLSDFFTYWLDYYEDKNNIDCYYDNKFYCILQNGEWNSNDYNVKLYIPFKYHDIKEGVIKIFDYLEDNNINHYSKITKYMRNDSVIIRLKSII